MSRKEKFGNSRGNRQQDKAANSPSIGTDSNEGEALPPRRKKHPSSNYKVTKWYYNLLFVLFVSLVAGLFWYGTKFTD
ncbi:hypothetical protein FHS16_004503 [Paenibacillus endophyticus]|uniref:Uncharacterized protein n=1 Tax=Paenibacillus endophyticus TaxID=1294268 RepID=A0A7W5GC29_9BACL|nr:hypothetical protein [Paenibacillus endophyticus]MBB3154421.1 hypothetical protein [Paenibacillus endophyticus]